MKKLLIDLETSPLTVYTWGLFNQNLSIDKIIDSSKLLCWSAKWEDSPDVFFDSLHESPQKKMVSGLYDLMHEADAVIQYNGNRFDIPVANKEFVLAGFPRPAPYKSIDLYRTVKRAFRFPSNKLDYVSQALGLGAKKKNPGFQMWIDCMNGDPAAWAVMKEYNIQDVLLLEKLYKRLLPWISNHPNVGVYDGTLGCPHCGSTHLNKRGFYHSSTMTYQRYQCTSCGAWTRDKKGVSSVEYVNAV